MRVLHLLKTSHGALWALRQVRQLVAKGIDVHVALPAGGPRIADFDAAGATTHLLQFDLPVHRFWTCPTIFAALREIVSRISPNIIHSHFVGTTLTMRLALGKHHQIPRIFQVPGPLHLEHTFFRWTDLSTAGAADFWIGTCKWTHQCYLHHGIPPQRVFHVGYGTELENYDAVPSGTLRRELGIDSETKVVGMVALMYAPKRFLAQTRGLKGHEDFIEALARCIRKDPQIMGVCIGGAFGNAISYEKHLRAYGKRRCGSQLIFMGTRPREEVPRLCRDFNVAVVPSLSENLGGVFEPLLQGIPVVATNVGGLPDVIRPKETGWLVPPRSPRDLSEAIMACLANPEKANSMAQHGRMLMRSLGNAKVNAERVITIYEQVLRQRA